MSLYWFIYLSERYLEWPHWLGGWISETLLCRHDPTSQPSCLAHPYLIDLDVKITITEKSRLQLLWSPGL